MAVCVCVCVFVGHILVSSALLLVAHDVRANFTRCEFDTCGIQPQGTLL